MVEYAGVVRLGGQRRKQCVLGYATSLDYLLRQLNTRRVVLTGQVTEQCILYSALDAYIRHFEVVVPCDAVAHIDSELSHAALRMMERNMGAAIVDGADWPR